MATRYPVTSLVGMRQAMDRLVDEVFRPSHFGTLWPVGGDGAGQSLIPIDAYSTDNEVVILAAVPGVSADSIDISIEQNTVTLSGEVPSTTNADETKGATWYLQELPSGTFRRSLTLPIEIDSGKAEASFESGILRLSLPKAEAAKPRQVRVQVGSGSGQAPAISGTADEK